MQTKYSTAKELYQKNFLFYEPHAKQRAFHAAGKNAIERAFIAGNRTGKTYGGCLEDAIHLTGIYPDWWEGHRFERGITAWIVSDTYETLRDSVQKDLFGGRSDDNDVTQALIHPSLILSKAMSSGARGAFSQVFIKHASGGHSELTFKSYKQGREKFQAARCNLIHLDEEPPKDIYDECKMRITDVGSMGQGIIMLTMTPLKGYTEMRWHFEEREVVREVAPDDMLEVESEAITESVRVEQNVVLNGRYFINAEWNDNPTLTEETKEHMRSSFKAHELEAREFGTGGSGVGLVYQCGEADFLIKDIMIQDHWGCFFGMDVGFFAPTAVVFLAHDRDNDVLYVYKEYSVTQRTAAQHAYSLNMMGCDWIKGVCDPSVNQGSQRDGARLVDDYAAAGLKLETGHYAKEFAVDSVMERIRTGRFKVFESCRKFMEEWRGYSRDDKGKIRKGRDHLMNALEFAILDGLPLARTKNESKMRYNNARRREHF